MNSLAFTQYLNRLPQQPSTGTRLWKDDMGCVQGSFFNSTLTSSFQPIRLLQSRRIVGVEAFARGVTPDNGLSVWRLLNNAASNDESIELDRLCRLVHTINYFRQHPLPQWSLYLNVHERLLAAVAGNHGELFRRVLDSLQLPYQRLVLQLPAVSSRQGWALLQVVESYRRHGFRFSVQARSLSDAGDLLDTVQPSILRVNASDATDYAAVLDLLKRAEKKNVLVIFQQLERSEEYLRLQRLAYSQRLPLYIQGYFLDTPSVDLPLPKRVLLGRPAVVRFYPASPVRERDKETAYAVRG